MMQSLQNMKDMLEMLETMKELFPEGFAGGGDGMDFSGMSEIFSFFEVNYSADSDTSKRLIVAKNNIALLALNSLNEESNYFYNLGIILEKTTSLPVFDNPFKKQSRVFCLSQYTNILNLQNLFTKFQRLDEDKNTTIEGLYTLKSIYKLLNNKKVNMPIINLIYDIIFNNKTPECLLTFLIEKE